MKKLSTEEMKKIVAGVQEGGIVGCKATANCSNGTTISCQGYSVGNIGGCNGTDANTMYNPGADGQVSCIEWVPIGPYGSSTFLSLTKSC